METYWDILHKEIQLYIEEFCWVEGFLYGKFHRDNDLPAIIQHNGDRYWYKDGNCHRDNDLPAVILQNGAQHWYKNGKHHRDNDLPAMVL